MAKQRIRIRLKAYDHKLLDQSAEQMMEKGLRFAIREGGHTVGAGVITEVLG